MMDLIKSESGNWMDNNNYKTAKILILIPIIVFVITAICMLLATMLEFSTDRGAIYSFFAMIGILSMFLTPLPCLVVSIMGTVFASRAINEGVESARKLLVIGIIECIAVAVATVIAIMMLSNLSSF